MKIANNILVTPEFIIPVDGNLATYIRLNIGKCKAISYSRRPELNTNYSISGVTVKNIENMKDLGVT